MPPLLNSYCRCLESWWSVTVCGRPLAQQFQMDVLLSKKLLTLDVTNVPIFKSCHRRKRWSQAVPAVGYFPQLKEQSANQSCPYVSLQSQRAARMTVTCCAAFCLHLPDIPVFPSENTRTAAKNILPLAAEILQNIPATKNLSNKHISLNKPVSLQTYRVTPGEKYFILISTSTILLLHSKCFFEEMTSRGSM